MHDSDYQYTTEGNTHHECSVEFLDSDDPIVICENYYRTGIDEILSNSEVRFILWYAVLGTQIFGIRPLKIHKHFLPNTC